MNKKELKNITEKSKNNDENEYSEYIKYNSYEEYIEATKKRLYTLEDNIGYYFKDISILDNATIHKSYANINKIKSNERLEFLGDSILEYVITNYLYYMLENHCEGDMTKIRAYIVCEDSLAKIAEKLKFEDYILISKSQSKSSGKSKSILADMVEAVIAAITLDSNIYTAKQFILNNFEEIIDYAVSAEYLMDYKTIYQEKIQEKGAAQIKYELVEETGPDHDKRFKVALIVNDKLINYGEGTSKKQAQINAAKTALKNMHVI